MATTLQAAYAQHVLDEYLRAKAQDLDIGNFQDTGIPQFTDGEFRDIITPVEPGRELPICIVGAGPTGLAIALMLAYVGFKNITILEASNRVGGRVFTYHFTKDPNCPHNYYDAGAMRLPEIETQKSTFEMIDYLNDNGLKVVLAPYTYDSGTEPSWYEFKDDTSGFDNYMQTLLYRNGFPVDKPDDWTNPPVEVKTFDKAFGDFMGGQSRPDHWSTRAWLMHGPSEESPSPPWDYMRTQIAETFDTSTGIFDQAFMETICDWYDFAASKKAKWNRVEGGMSKLTDAMRDLAVKKGVKLFLNAPVTAMAADSEKVSVEHSGRPKLYKGEASPGEDYKAVFSTTTFGCLQRMDLQGLNLTSDNYCGIRALAYDRATKVAIKFKKGWWRDRVPNGGVSGTDMPISNVVYPSWSEKADDAHYTIIVSYSWAQDATRMASLIGANGQESTNPKDPIIQLCFRCLAKLWDNKPSFDELESMYLAHHAFAWAHDPNTAGAFALFGPGQFEYLYPQFTRPLCNNMLSICGEAVSAHHAWISGAFDSAYNAVYTWCNANGYFAKAEALKASNFGQGKDKNTAELDEGLMRAHLALPRLAELKHAK